MLNRTHLFLLPDQETWPRCSFRGCCLAYRSTSTASPVGVANCPFRFRSGWLLAASNLAWRVSRRFSIAVMFLFIYKPISARRASMRPRSLDRGNRHIHHAHILGRDASMRPRSLDRGNLLMTSSPRSSVLASMRPRSLDRGNSTNPGGEVISSSQLQ